MLIQHALQVFLIEMCQVDARKDDRGGQEHDDASPGNETGRAGNNGHAGASDGPDWRNEGRCDGY